MRTENVAGVRTLAWTFTLWAMGTLVALAEPVPERLYPSLAPGSEQWAIPESDHLGPDGTTVYENVREPTLTAYAPAMAPPNGTSVIVLPGGALRFLGVGPDIRDVIRTLNAQGITVFLLKYRVLQHEAVAASAPPPTRPPAFPKRVIRNGNANPAPGDAGLSNVLQLATDDAQAAVRKVRGEAARYHLDPARVGLLGYSAGGGVALALEQRAATDARPAFIATAYGPSLLDVHVAADAPPLFIATETSHGPVTDGLLALAQLWRDAARPVELHMYDVPAFGMPSSLWLERMVAWLKTHQLLDP